MTSYGITLVCVSIALLLLLIAACTIVMEQYDTIREQKHQLRHDRKVFEYIYDFIQSDPYISEAADKWKGNK